MGRTIEVEKVCTACKLSKPTSEYHRNKRTKGGYCNYCKVCKNFRNRDWHTRSTYGLTLVEYQEKLAKQNHACSICNISLPTSGSTTNLDHDHSTGKLRDFLCMNCNRGLGHFQDNASSLNNAASYIRRHNG